MSGFSPKLKEIKWLCGGVVYCAAQASAQIDAEIGQKDHLWMETNWQNVIDDIITYFESILLFGKV